MDSTRKKCIFIFGFLSHSDKREIKINTVGGDLSATAWRLSKWNRDGFAGLRGDYAY